MSTYRAWSEKDAKDQIDPTFSKAQFDDAVQNSHFDEVSVAVAAATRGNDALGKSEDYARNSHPSSNSVADNTVAVKLGPSQAGLHLQEQTLRQQQQLQSQGSRQAPEELVNGANSSDSASQILAEANKLAAQQDPVMLANRNRSLSSSKRAAQNRNAQRAFRMRKEQYIKDLERQVEKVKDLELEIDGLKKENQELRNYILTLQNKLINDVPPLNIKK